MSKKEVFDLDFRAFKSLYRITALKAEYDNIVYMWKMERPHWIVSYKKDGNLDQFDFYGSYQDYLDGKYRAKTVDLFYMIKARLDDAITAINCPTLCDFLSEFGYDLDRESCQDTLETFENLRKAKREVLNIWDEDELFKAINRMQVLEDKL